MSDKIFFSLIACILAAMVAIAAWNPPEACPSGSVSVSTGNYKVIPLTGIQLHRFITKDYVTKSVCDGESNYVLNLTAPANTVYPASPDVGPHFRLASDIETTVAGHPIKVVIEARGLTTDAAFELNYYTGPEGSSGWEKFDLATKFQQFVLDYQVPKQRQDQGVDFLALRPLHASDDQNIEIRRVTILNLGRMSAAERQKALSEHIAP